MFTIRAIISAMLLVIIGETAAIAQPAVVAIAEDRDWEHRWTEMRFPARLGNYERDQISSYRDAETNMGSRYLAVGGDTILSIYIYRAGNPDPSLWHDRALTALLSHRTGQFAPETLVVKTFVPEGGSAASGIRSVLAGKGPFRSTGSALFRAGEWLVKLRLSSKRLSVEELDAELDAVLQRLPRLGDISSIPAYRIDGCALPFEVEEADRVGGYEDLIPLALTSGLASAAASETPPLTDSGALVRYCVEGERGGQFAIYRPDDGTDRYFIAAGDAGFGLTIEPAATLGDMVAELSPGVSSPRIYLVKVTGETKTEIFQPFGSLPTPQQAIDAVTRERPIAAISRPLDGKDGPDITLFVDSEGDD